MKREKFCVVCEFGIMPRYLFKETLNICEELISTYGMKNGSIPYILLKDGRELYFVKTTEATKFTEGMHDCWDISDRRYEICLECYFAEREAAKKIATEIITRVWDEFAGNTDEWIVDFIKSLAQEHGVEVK